MKAMFVVLSLLVYTTQSAAQGELAAENTESAAQGELVTENTESAAEGELAAETRDNESPKGNAEGLRACLLEKTWSECGLVSVSESSSQATSGSIGSDSSFWKLRGPWAKTIADYSTQ